MTYNLTYVRCTNPTDKQSAPYEDQAEASSSFQSIKGVMKAENDSDGGAPHFIEIGVTDDQGKPVDGYKHKCSCARPF